MDDRLLGEIQDYFRYHGAATVAEIVRNLGPAKLLRGHSKPAKKKRLDQACQIEARHAVAQLWREDWLRGPVGVHIGGKNLSYWICDEADELGDKFRGHPFTIRQSAKSIYPWAWKDFVPAPKPDPNKISYRNAAILHIIDTLQEPYSAAIATWAGVSRQAMDKKLKYLEKLGLIQFYKVLKTGKRGRPAVMWMSVPFWRERAPKKFNTMEMISKTVAPYDPRYEHS